MAGSQLYRLVGTEVEPVENLEQWAMWFDQGERRIARTELSDAMISTVFLGTDHGFSSDRAPILFKTMVFPVRDGVTGMYEIDQYRCSTYAEALEMHTQAHVCYLWEKGTAPADSVRELLSRILAGWWPTFAGWCWNGRLIATWEMRPMSVEISGAEAVAQIESAKTQVYPLLKPEDYQFNVEVN
jgi:hypothetical protein